MVGYKSITYDYIMKTLGLSTKSSLWYFDVKANDNLSSRVINRALVFTDTMLLCICHKGSCVASIGGSSYAISAGRMFLVFVGAHCRFTYLTPDFESSVLICHIPTATISGNLANNFPKIKSNPVLSLSPQEGAIVSALLNYIRLSSANDNGMFRTELDASIGSVLHNELSSIILYHNYEVKEASADELLAKRFGAMLSASTLEHRNVGFFAREFDLSPKRFSIKIKKVTGQTPSEMINAAVIRSAKRLLLSTDLTSREIAEKLNFASPSFFCRYFHRYTGQTPSEWREGNTE